jgi:hypothetical protein
MITMRRIFAAFLLLGSVVEHSQGIRLLEDAPLLRRHRRSINTTPRALQASQGGEPLQTGPDPIGPSFVSAVAYNKNSQALHLTGSTYGRMWDNDWEGVTAACFYAVLDLGATDSPLALVHAQVLGVPNVAESCNHLAVDEEESRVFLLGQSYAGGLESQFESTGGLTDSILFGMLLHLNYDNIGNAAEAAELVGGRLLQDSRVVYPVAAAKESGENILYVASLETDEAFTNDPVGGVWQDPTRYFPVGTNYRLRVTGHEILPVLGGATTSTLQLTLDAPSLVDAGLEPEQGLAVMQVGGLVKVGDFVIVAGTTAGQGLGFGTRNAPGSDTDGFVTRIDAATGVIADAGGLGGNPTYRVWSTLDGDDSVHGLCYTEGDSSFLYAVGTTAGRVGFEDAPSTGSTAERAYVVKIRISDMAAVWTVELEGNGDAFQLEGVSCAVSSDGTEVYVGGNVVSEGDYVVGSDVTESYGQQDVFVAKIDSANDGQVLWTRQIGSEGVDSLAYRGGLATLADDSGVVVVGNSEGSMYRTRDGAETSYSDVFALVIASDGTYTLPSGGQGGGGNTPATPTPPVTPTPPPVPTPAPKPAPVAPSPPSSDSNSDESKSTRRREEWEALLILLLVGIGATFAAMCAQQYWYTKRESITDRGKVLDYLQSFDVEDIDLKHSATGGWHCSYVNDLARGVIHHSGSPNGGSSKATFLADSDYDSPFDPLDSHASPPTTPESKVLQDSLFVIEDGEEVMTFGNDRSTRDGMGSAYNNTWEQKSPKSNRRTMGRKSNVWGREII